MYYTDKIAVLLATYNGEKYIGEQIDSILNQSYQDFVVYIHDDGSKDNTVEILKTYERNHPEQIIIIDGESTGGAKTNFLYLFSQVEAPFYMCCDQDDVWLEHKIEVTKKEMDSLVKADEDKPCLVFTELAVVGEDLTILSDKMSIYQGLDCKKVCLNRGLIQNIVTGCTIMVNRVLREELGKIKDMDGVLMHDWWALLVAARFGKVSFIEAATILYRQHGNNGVGAQNSNSLFYNMERMMQGEAIKKSLADTRKQAKAFADLYEEGAGSLVREYANLEDKGKFARMRFYDKYDVKKSTKAKNFGLLIWG